MKKTLTYLSIIFIIGFLFSCKKDTTPENNNISNDEAAEIIASYLGSGNGGSSAQFEDAATYSEQIINDTTQQKMSNVYDTVFTVSKDTGRITFNYQFHYQYGIDYNSTMGNYEFFMNFDTDGTFSSLKFYSEDNSEGSLTLTGLEQDIDFYTVNGNVSRTGNQTVTVQEKKTVTASLVFNFNNIKIRKSDYVITEGSGDLTLKGETSEGQEFSLSGTVVYKGDGTIKLTVNGEEYIINLDLGEIQN